MKKLLAARLILGLIFLLAGLGKLGNPHEFANAVVGYHVLPYSLALLYGYVLPWAEILIGGLFLIGISLKPVAIMSLVIINTFMVANVIDLTNSSGHCSDCLGGWAVLLPGVALGIDLIMAFLAVMIAVKT